MKKILFVLLAVLVVAVSCTDRSVSETASVRFGRLEAKSTVSGEVASAASLYWKYKATKVSGITYGQTSDYVALGSGAGLDYTINGFAPGEWKFQLRGYLDSGYTKLIYESTATNATLTAGETSTVTFNVDIVDGSYGTLKTTNPASVLGSTAFTVTCEGIHSDTTTKLSSPNPTANTLKQGLWTLKYTFKDTATLEVLGTTEVTALIMNGATTTVTLTYEAQTGSFKASVNTPSIDDWTSVPVSYEVGDVGPAGGYIFYKAPTKQTSTYKDLKGNDVTYTWQYLEVAPEDVSDSTVIFGYNRKSGTNATVQSSLDTSITSSDHSTYNGNAAVGQGRLNTSLLVKAMGSSAYSSDSGTAATASYAAKLCDDYTYGGYNDWFLPSIEELRYIYENLKSKSIGTWSDYCWSSTEYSGSDSWSCNFKYGSVDSNDRGYGNYVCAVRAF